MSVAETADQSEAHEVIAPATLAGDPEMTRRRWPLLPVQRVFEAAAHPLWAASELSARLLGKKDPTPRENTRRCYEQFFDPLCAETGVWPDYTEGYYPTGDEEYEEAKLGQFDYILDKLGAGEGTRVLDLGCGNGKLLERARERGCVGTGITISRVQAQECQRQGLDVRVCSFDEAQDQFKPGEFDVVILNGPTEHFVSELDALDGKDEAIRAGLFDLLKHVVKPGGRVFITCIHFRVDTDIREVIKHPLQHRVGSYYFYCSNLVRIYSGWYVPLGSYERLAEEAGFSTIHCKDATRDYYLTSRHWSVRLQKFVKNSPGFMARFMAGHFAADPRYFLNILLFWMYDPWTWQFRGGDNSPMVHLWMMLQRDP